MFIVYNEFTRDKKENSMLVKSGYSRDNREYNFTPFNLTNNKPCNNSHCKAIDMQGNLRDVKITSIKIWKTKSDIEIHWKYGLYDYGSSLLTSDGFVLGVTLGIAELIEKEG